MRKMHWLLGIALYCSVMMGTDTQIVPYDLNNEKTFVVDFKQLLSNDEYERHYASFSEPVQNFIEEFKDWELDDQEKLLISADGCISINTLKKYEHVQNFLESHVTLEQRESFNKVINHIRQCTKLTNAFVKFILLSTLQ